MRRSAVLIAASLAMALSLGPAGAPAASAGPGDELLYNPGLEVEDNTGGAPAFWTSSTWGNSDPSPNRVRFTWASPGHGGNRSARVDVEAYTDGGDSKWVPDLVSVTGGRYYTFSDWYKSDVNTAVSVYYETDADGDGVVDGHWANLFSGIAPASTWTRYTTGFTMPAGAIRARFVHFIAAEGYLETDDYSVREVAAPPGFSRPMISLTFDDGSQAVYDEALSLLNEKGFKTTQYIPTKGLSPHTDPFLMTPDEVRTMAAQGHEIGSHSVTHPELPTLSLDELNAELRSSRSLLETITGQAVDDFAYPFGLYDAKVIAALGAAGYRSGRSVEEGYNARLDVEPYDIRVQNMTSATTPAQFREWVDYAKAHRYWLVVVYHEVVPDGTPRCSTGDNCQGDYDTTNAEFAAQLEYISRALPAESVMTVGDALKAIDAELHPPPSGTPEATPTPRPTAGPVPSTPRAAAVDKLAPRITVTSLKARTYRLGQRLTIRFGCTDGSGVATCKATLRRSGGPARTVRNGARIRLTRTGKHVLRVIAKDRAGNTASKTVAFRVVRR